MYCMFICISHRKRAAYSHIGYGLRPGLPILRRPPPLLTTLYPGTDSRCGRATHSGRADESGGQESWPGF